ncbi:MAG: A/G-specific adenine glycosylase [Spirochaeta sp.]|jgi:A/G-specific adenine glycosylase|nr:A/G-specific adenine glycosylase [Spirochaeta sp.]
MEQAELFSDLVPTFPPRGFDSERTADRDVFVDTIWNFYRRAKREMVWRDDTSPYAVFVSEVMLQQTQVSRVAIKFPPFVQRFPDFATLAGSPLSEVLAMWTGLGYNRRARFLHRSAQLIIDEHGGTLPDTPEELVMLPGIGPNTAGSVAAFAYNRPVVFIETNIRRVFISAFFPETEAVHDRMILPIVEQTLQRDNPREWYWALMDVGVALARSSGNANRRSVHYARQSAFENSDRQLRGRILRILTERGGMCAEELPEYTGFPEDRVILAVDALEREELVRRRRDDDATRVVINDG